MNFTTITNEIQEKFPLTDEEHEEIHKFSAFYANKMQEDGNLLLWSKVYDNMYEELYIKYKPDILKYDMKKYFDKLEVDQNKPFKELLFTMFKEGIKYQKNKGK